MDEKFRYNNLFVWQNNIPGFIFKKQNIVRTALFTAIFALAFINFYSPFDLNIWLEIKTQIHLFFYSSLVILTGFLVIVISRVILYYHSKHNNISYLKFAIWILVEIASMAAFYALFVNFILIDQRNFLEIYKASIKNTALILLLPYTIVWLYLAWKEKTEKLEELSHKDDYIDHSNKMLPFHDEKGTMRFSILLNDLLYLEASDNYVTIHYNNNEKISKYLIRNTLKAYEQALEELNIIRCHRSFMVNFDKVKIMRKEKDGVHLELNTTGNVSLPVSKTYLSQVFEAFSKYTI